MRYRKEIDGLRAFALLPVIFFHAGFEWFSGGYVGVDIFFVISGYLITSLILTEKDAGTFSIVVFYERRARRILPALFFVILVCLPFAWMWMYPNQLVGFADSVIAVSVFASNILFFNEIGYFAPAAELKPLLHTWSLAVEEQFYLVFPVFIMLLWNRGKRCLVAVISVVALSSLAFAQFGGNLNFSAPYLEPDFQFFAQAKLASFYLPTGRVWELMIGALVAFYLQTSTVQRRHHLANWASGVGFLLIIYSIFAFDRETPFPSFYTLVPTAGTALLILFATPNTFVGKLFSLPIFVGVGLISYSAYLWHLPLFVFARLRSLHEPGPWLYVALSFAALGLAYLSWRYVERPFRDRQKTSRRQIFYGAFAISLSMIVVGLLGHFNDGYRLRIQDDVYELLAYGDDAGLGRNDKNCFAGPDIYIAPKNRCVVGAEVNPSIAILGDSHALTLATVLGEQIRDRGSSAKVLTYEACIPILGLAVTSSFQDRYPDRIRCHIYNDEVYSYLAENSDIEYVVLSGRWTLYLEKYRFDNGEGGVEYGDPVFSSPVDSEEWQGSEERRRQLVAAYYAKGIKDLLRLNKTIIVVYPIPEVGWDVPEYLARARMYGTELDGQLSTSYSQFKKRNTMTLNALDAVADDPNLVRVLPSEIFCDTYLKGRCVAQNDGVPLYFDDDHLNSVGASHVVEEILASIY